ncbi:MAG: hypothetical protein LBL18_02175 [Bacteroidales bacterium]|jgi:hypothetical protein|nr:hypothetical protein [Bacteroidales bacterium]
MKTQSGKPGKPAGIWLYVAVAAMSVIPVACKKECTITPREGYHIEGEGKNCREVKNEDTPTPPPPDPSIPCAALSDALANAQAAAQSGEKTTLTLSGNWNINNVDMESLATLAGILEANPNITVVVDGARFIPGSDSVDVSDKTPMLRKYSDRGVRWNDGTGVYPYARDPQAAADFLDAVMYPGLARAHEVRASSNVFKNNRKVAPSEFVIDEELNWQKFCDLYASYMKKIALKTSVVTDMPGGVYPITYVNDANSVRLADESRTEVPESAVIGLWEDMPSTENIYHFQSTSQPNGATNISNITIKKNLEGVFKLLVQSFKNVNHFDPKISGPMKIQAAHRDQTGANYHFSNENDSQTHYNGIQLIDEESIGAIRAACGHSKSVVPTIYASEFIYCCDADMWQYLERARNTILQDHPSSNISIATILGAYLNDGGFIGYYFNLIAETAYTEWGAPYPVIQVAKDWEIGKRPFRFSTINKSSKQPGLSYVTRKAISTGRKR